MSDRILAIDPGDKLSAWCLIHTPTRRPLDSAIDSNDVLAAHLRAGDFGQAYKVIEMIASYGMPVGAEVFETCVWIGRFCEIAMHDGQIARVPRQPVKLHHCHTSHAKDTNITHALIDRFAPGVRNRGKGTKDHPGWFYGFHDDIWQAYALGVYIADQHAEQEPAEPLPPAATQGGLF